MVIYIEKTAISSSDMRAPQIPDAAADRPPQHFFNSILLIMAKFEAGQCDTPVAFGSFDAVAQDFAGARP